ncbi:MAG TPA: NUDIX domain-containing protein [Candidatus Saccharimonadales bacterium]|nr:NUDIX domain-containing protein [Candidatus Saccharimonadales bacterium]
MRKIIPSNARLVPKEAKRVFKGEIFDVYQWRQQMFDGSFETFEMLKRPDTIKVIAVKDYKIVVLNQKQPDSEQFFFDLPGGRHDYDNESELDAAKRETREETGMSFKDWRLVNVSQPHGKIDWFVYIFLATGFESQQAQQLDAGEKIKVELKSFEELKELVSYEHARFLPAEIINSCETLEDVLSLAEYKTGATLK